MPKLPLLGCVALCLFVACGSDSEDPAGGNDKDAAAGGASGGSSATGGSGASDSGNGGSANAANGGSAGGGGQSGPNVDMSDPQLYEFELDPQVLDPSTVDSLEIQYAQLDTRTTPVGKLVIFLSGATNTPDDWRDHGRELAKFGFHVVIPHYNNRWSTEGVCDGVGGSCSVDTRWEALVGEDTSSAIAISRADSAEGRVVTMLKHLTTAHVGGDWGYYLDASSGLRYEDIVIGGISHGGASTGLYAERRAFSRAIIHASGAAGDSDAPKATPLSEWYAFVHTEDPAYDAITSSWDSYNLVGALTSIDGAAAPYSNSHRLTTSEASSYPHGSVAAHGSSPTDANGDYIFEPAWRYLYGVSP